MHGGDVPRHGSSSSSEQTPLKKRITSAPVPPSRFVMPNLDKYDGTGDPREHVQDYKVLMEIHGADDSLLCRAFQTTLRKSAKEWYNQLPHQSLGLFESLAQAFCQEFIAGRRRLRSTNHLFNLVQEEGETLRSFIERFKSARLDVERCREEVTMAALKRGIRCEDLVESLTREPPINLDDLLTTANVYMTMEEELAARDSKPRLKRRFV